MRQQPWNKGWLVGLKAPLRLRDIWAIRVRLRLRHAARDLALFDLAIDSKLRACDLVKLRVLDVAHGDRVSQRATVLQQKTQRPVQFEITEQTRAAISAWMAQASLHQDAFLFPEQTSRFASPLNSAVRTHRRPMDRGYRLGRCCLGRVPGSFVAACVSADLRVAGSAGRVIQIAMGARFLDGGLPDRLTSAVSAHDLHFSTLGAWQQRGRKREFRQLPLGKRGNFNHGNHRNSTTTVRRC